MKKGCVRLAVLGLALGPAVPATADQARVTLKAAQLSVTNTSVTVVRRNPLEIDLRATVVDARGSGRGWAVTVGAASRAPQRGPLLSANTPILLATLVSAKCLPGSSCTLPSHDIPYPVAVTLSGARTPVFDADAGSGLGAQSIDVRLTAPLGTPPSVSLGVSLLDQP